MKITESDLIGKLEGFPIAVVKKMLKRQKQQKGWKDIKAFQGNPQDLHKGFNWDITPEGYEFWDEVFSYQKFDVFFDRYPAKILADCSGRVKLHLAPEPSHVTNVQITSHDNIIWKGEVPLIAIIKDGVFSYFNNVEIKIS